MTQLEFVKDQIDYLSEEDKFELAEAYVEANSFEPVYKMDLELMFDVLQSDISEFISETINNEDFDKNDKYFTFDGYGHIETFDDLIDHYGLTDLAKFAIDNQDKVDYMLDFQEEEEEDE